MSGEKKISDSKAARMLIPVGQSGWAIAAGYLGLFSIVLIGAPFAIIVSIIAIVDIKKSQKTGSPKYGMSRAIFGLGMGLLIPILILLFITQL